MEIQCTLKSLRNLYGVSSNKDGSIASFWDSSTFSWQVNFRRGLKDDEISSFEDLISLVSSKSLASSNDRLSWSLEASGSFSVKSASDFLAIDSPMDDRLYNVIWKSKSPRKVNVFIWILINGRLNTSEMLQRKLQGHCLQPSICVFCSNCSESSNHILFSCEYSQGCWNALLSLFKIPWVFANRANLNTSQLLLGPLLKKKARFLWVNAVKSLLYELWWERNQRIFHDSSRPWLIRSDSARLQATLWAVCSSRFANYSIQQLSSNWEAFL